MVLHGYESAVCYVTITILAGKLLKQRQHENTGGGGFVPTLADLYLVDTFLQSIPEDGKPYFD